MPTPELEAIQDFFENEKRGDLDAVLATFADDACLVLPRGTSFGGRYIGKKRIKEAFALLGQVYPTGLDLTTVELSQSGNKVFAELEWTAATVQGARVDEQEVFVFEMDGAKIREARVFSMGGEFEALGHSS